MDAVDFHHPFGPALIAWRDANVVPRYGAAGVRRFAFLMPKGYAGPATTEQSNDPAVFATRRFVDREEAIRWISAADAREDA